MFDVGRHRHLDSADDARHGFDHLASRDDAAVGVPERGRNAGAGGGNRWKPFGFEDARGCCIPRVRQNENRRTLVQGPQSFRFIGHGAKYIRVRCARPTPRRPLQAAGAGCSMLRVCQRNTSDPLVLAFLDNYGLNLLSIPRKNAICGDLYIAEGARVSTPGRITQVLVPPPVLPEPVTGELLTELTGVVSRQVSADVGLGLSEK